MLNIHSLPLLYGLQQLTVSLNNTLKKHSIVTH
jgi:hypothetical protein